MAGNKRTWMYLQRPFENGDVKPDKARPFQRAAMPSCWLSSPPPRARARATVRVAAGRLGEVRGSRRFWVVLRRWGGCRHSARSLCFLRLGVP